MDVIPTLIFWGMTLTVLGKGIVIVAALMIHSKILQEKKIDGVVLKEYKKERMVVFLGLILILVGYVLELIGLDLPIFS